MIALPVTTREDIPVLWALHCAMEDGDYFFRYLDAARLVNHLNIGIIAPSLGNGFFLNTSYEPQADFLEEIYESLHHLLRISAKPDKCAVIGISMGGFGAMRWALESTHFYAAAAISGAFDANMMVDPRVLEDLSLNAINNAFHNLLVTRLTDWNGDLPKGGSLHQIVETHAGKWPELYFFCGEEDYLSIAQTKAFYELCKKYGAPATLRTYRGSHNLEFWRWAFPEAVKLIFKDKVDKGG